MGETEPCFSSSWSTERNTIKQTKTRKKLECLCKPEEFLVVYSWDASGRLQLRAKFVVRAVSATGSKQVSCPPHGSQNKQPGCCTAGTGPRGAPSSAASEAIKGAFICWLCGPFLVYEALRSSWAFEVFLSSNKTLKPKPPKFRLFPVPGKGTTSRFELTQPYSAPCTPR